MYSIKQYNVIYNSLSLSDKGMMPIGNGEIGVSLWATEKAVSFYISRTDSLSECDRNLKLGMVTIPFSHKPLHFRQELDLESGTIYVEADELKLTAFVGKEDNIIRVGSNLPIQAQYSTWRKSVNKSVNDMGLDNTKLTGIAESQDIVMEQGGKTCFYHHNETSIVEHTAKLEGLEECISVIKDPLKGRTFGGILSHRPFKKGTETLIATFSELDLPQRCLDKAKRIIENAQPFDVSHKKTADFWKSYFTNSYIYIANDKPQKPMLEEGFEKLAYENTQSNDTPSQVTRAYILSKYLIKCCTGGTYPIRFNGGHFNLSIGVPYGQDTMPRSITSRPPEQPDLQYSADERSWGNMLLWQNERLPYYSMMAQNEYEDIRKFLEFYCSFAAINAVKAKKYYNAEGEYNTEIITSFGLTPNYLYGYDRTNKSDGYVENRYGGAVDISPGLEQSYFMLRFCEFYQDKQFLSAIVMPFINNLFRYIETRFSQREQNKLVLHPLNAIETYWDTLNPITVVAGLKSVIKAICDCSLLEDKDKAFYRSYALQVPDFTFGKTDEGNVLLPAHEYDETRNNVECPEIYALFPFDNLMDEIGGQTALNTYHNALKISGNFCGMKQGSISSVASYCGWHYEGIVAATLGLREHCRQILEYNCSFRNINARFPALWGPAYDSLPDIDHAANIVNQLQVMVMQVKGDTIYVLPALPLDWDADFKLWVDKDTYVLCQYSNGKVINLSCNNKKYILKIESNAV